MKPCLLALQDDRSNLGANLPCGTLQNCKTAKETKKVKHRRRTQIVGKQRTRRVNNARALLMELYFNLDQARSDSSSWFGTPWSLSDGGDLAAGPYCSFNRLLSAQHSHNTDNTVGCS